MDFFVSYAHEDRETIARPLAEMLIREGFSVWFDEFSLTLGDSLRAAIDKGLSECRYGIVILSPHFFAKHWPQRELDGLTAREAEGHKVILPVWHQIDFRGVREHSPTLAGRYAASTEKGLGRVVDYIVAAVRAEAPVARSGVDDILMMTVDLVELESSLLGDDNGMPTWQYVHNSTYHFHVTFDEPLKFGLFAYHRSDRGIIPPEGSIIVTGGSRAFDLHIEEVPALHGRDFAVTIEPTPTYGDWLIIRQQFRSPSLNAIYAEHAATTLVVHKNMRYNCIDGSVMTSRVERFIYRLHFPPEYPIDMDAVVPIVGTVSNSFDHVHERELERVTREASITRARAAGRAQFTMDVREPLVPLHYGFAWNALPRSLCGFVS
jgi:hypothetical protein